ncbi:MAG: J domain-containing protein [Cyanobium sp.]
MDQAHETWKRTSLALPQQTVDHLEQLRREWGLKHRGAVLERLLQQVFGDDDGEADADLLPEDLQAVAERREADGELDEQVALVLIGRGALEPLASETDSTTTTENHPSRGKGGGIDLPGFVRNRTSKLKRDLDPSRRQAAAINVVPLQVSAELLEQALQEARDHWINVYGNAPNATVLENAMIWLAYDIWPQCDQSEGRVFTWTAVCEVMRDIVPGWRDDPPSFERVMVTAGVLEDPFSPGTLALRLPTLIRRFVHRFRRRGRGSSFQTLEHTMTLQGALRLLKLPTDPGKRLALSQIRESYRELALSHHPDAGGSVEAMRRINEAYQLLKELYRHRPEPKPS